MYESQITPLFLVPETLTKNEGVSGSVTSYKGFPYGSGVSRPSVDGIPTIRSRKLRVSRSGLQKGLKSVHIVDKVSEKFEY